jgi:hypothetical protein
MRRVAAAALVSILAAALGPAQTLPTGFRDSVVLTG